MIKYDTENFSCNITEDERKAFAENAPIIGLENCPDWGAAVLERLADYGPGIDIELNINPDKSERGIISYFVCRRMDGDWADIGYADDDSILGNEGKPDKKFIDFNRPDWKDRLRKDMTRVLDAYIRKEHPYE